MDLSRADVGNSGLRASPRMGCDTCSEAPALKPASISALWEKWLLEVYSHVRSSHEREMIRTAAFSM